MQKKVCLMRRHHPYPNDKITTPINEEKLTLRVQKNMRKGGIPKHLHIYNIKTNTKGRKNLRGVMIYKPVDLISILHMLFEPLTNRLI